MKRDAMMVQARRLLQLMDTGTTDLAAELYERPLEVFTSPELFLRERREIFGRTPMFIGLSSELPKPGSFFTRDLVDTPYLALRHLDGDVRLYLNVCRHRGAKVVAAACGSAMRFTCPFHGWSYDADGRLATVTEPEGFEGLDRAARGLVELPVAEKYGLIFGCATPGTSFDIDEVLGGLGPELRDWGFEDMTMYGEPHVHIGSGNWKYTWDTFCENYHFAFLHQDTLKDYLVSRRQGFDVFGRNVRIISAMKSIEEMRKLPEDQWEPERHVSIQYRLYPSINFSIYPGFLTVFWVLPGKTASDSQALHVSYLTHPPETAAEKADIEEVIRRGCQDVVQDEDFWVTGQAELGMRAPGGTTFVIGRNEPAVQHFHRLFEQATS